MNRWIVPLMTALLAVGVAHTAAAQGQGQGKPQTQTEGKNQGQGKSQSQGQGKDDHDDEWQGGGKDADNRGQVVSECNHRANEKKLKGQERKDFVEWCESRGGRYGYDDRRYDNQRSCYQRANDRGLSGDQRRAFLDRCLDDSDRKYEGSKSKETSKDDQGGLGEVLKRGDQKN